jgi:general stress protein 26
MSDTSFTPGALIQVAQETIAAAKFPQLATIDGDQPRVRPVSPVKVDGFTVYVANLRSYAKSAQIAANANVELCYLSPDHDQVRITGVAKVETDAQVLDELWQSNPLLRKYLGSQDNPELIIYRIEPSSVRFMREWALEYHDVPLD